MSSDTSTTSLAICTEEAFADLPDDCAFSLLRFTGESIGHQKTTIQSGEIRADRQVSGLTKVGAGASGAVNFELSLIEYEDLILAAIGQTAWTEQTHSDDASISGQTVTFDTLPDGFVEAGYIYLSNFPTPSNNGVKRIVSVSGTAITLEPGSLTAEVTGARTVTRRFATNGTAQRSYTLERAVLIDDGAYAYQSHSGMTVGGMSLKIASMEQVTGSFTFLGKTGSYASRSQRRAGESAASGILTLTGNAVADETVTIGVGTGQKVYTWKAAPTTVANQVKVGATASESIDNLIAAIMGGTGSGSLYGSATVAHTQVSAEVGTGDTMNVNALITDQDGTFGNTIATTEVMANATWGAATLTGGVDADAYTAATTQEVVNGTNNVVTIASGAAALTDPAKSFSFSINNNLRPKDKIGQEGAFEIGQGQFNVTGSLECYFESNAMFGQIVDHDDVSLSVLLQDSDGNLIGITFPRVKLSDGNPNTGANNQDVMITAPFTAIADPVSGVTMVVDTFTIN